MKTVGEIFIEVPALKNQGMPPRDIACRLADIGYENGFGRIMETGSRKTLELLFNDKEIIAFDGANWRYFYWADGHSARPGPMARCCSDSLAACDELLA